MRCTAAGMIKFLFLVCGADQTAVASLHLAMACFHSGGHICLDVHTGSCIWSLPMFSHLVSSAAVHLIQVRYMAQCIVSACWSWCTSLESLECLSKLQSGGSPTLHSLSGGSFFPPDLSDKVAAINGHVGFPFYCIGMQFQLASNAASPACQGQTCIPSCAGGWWWCFQLSRLE